MTRDSWTFTREERQENIKKSDDELADMLLEWTKFEGPKTNCSDLAVIAMAETTAPHRINRIIKLAMSKCEESEECVEA